MLKDSHAIAAKTSLEVMISLYKVSNMYSVHNTAFSVKEYRFMQYASYLVHIFNWCVLFFFSS